MRDKVIRKQLDYFKSWTKKINRNYFRRNGILIKYRKKVKSILKEKNLVNPSTLNL